ncbi:MAG: DEAD/DEAH box helicase family protein, partial [Candidatus Methanospirareceae archaeon]
MLVVKIGDHVFYKDADTDFVLREVANLRKFFFYDSSSKTWVFDPAKFDGNSDILCEYVAELFNVGKSEVYSIVKETVRKYYSEEYVEKLRKLLERGIFAVVPSEPLDEKRRLYADTFFTHRRGLYFLDVDKVTNYVILRNVRSAKTLARAIKYAMDVCGFRYLDGHVEWLEANAKTLLEDAMREYARRTTMVLNDTGSDVEILIGRNLTKRELAILRETFTTVYYTADAMGNLTEHRMRVIKYDRSRGTFRIPYFAMPRLLKVAQDLGFKKVVDNVRWIRKKIPTPPKFELKLYKFQARALKAWARAGFRGVIVVPTGGGKTYIGMAALYHLSVPTLICVTTIELARQWKQKLEEHLGIKAALLGGGSREIGDVTVAIYNSAVNHVDALKDKFELIIFDECLTYDTLVLTDRGWIPIGEIVEKRLPVRVLTHRGRFMPVVGWHKVPLRKRLVRVVLENGTEIRCTEDHKFLTDVGWVEAIKLLGRNVLYKINDEVVSIGEREALPDLWKEDSKYAKTLSTSPQGKIETEPMLLVSEGVSEQGCTWGTLFDSTCRSREKRKNSGTPSFKEKRSGEMEGSTQKEYGEKGGLEEGDNFNGDSKESDTWYFVRGWQYEVSEQEEQKHEVVYKTLFEPVRVCHVEVLDAEEYHKNEAEDRGKQRIRPKVSCISHYVLTLSNRNIQADVYRWKKNDKQEVVKGDRPSDSSCHLDHGRQYCIGETTSFENKPWACNGGGSDHLTRMAGHGLGCRVESLQCGKGVRSVDTTEARSEEIDRNNRALCNSVDEIQDFVYDITVAEDHSYVANGVVVHNCHHVPADSFRKVAFLCKARKRLGLSATPKRSDRNEALIFFSVGD